MALSGLDIYKHLPKTNCRECGFPTCLAFALALAKKAVSLDKCPHISEAAKAMLEASTQPPIKLVSIINNEKKIELGNESVLFRHEEKFHHPTAIGFIIEDGLTDEKIKERLKKIGSLKFERIGQQLSVDLIGIRQTKDQARFAEAVKLISGLTDLGIVLMSDDPAALKAALANLKNQKPLIYAASNGNSEQFIPIAKEHNAVLVIRGDSLEAVSGLSKKAGECGLSELVIDVSRKGNIRKTLCDLTQARRLALKKANRLLGYPLIVVLENADPFDEIIETGDYIAKYASVILLSNSEPWAALALLTLRQNIYTDPQKPLQIEPKLYQIGNADAKSPVLVTTNFSLTYYTVLGEVEASKVPSYIASIDTEGMSVLTAWAAEKFTPDKISESLKKFAAEEKVSHRNLIIPGYVAVMSGDLEEKSGWKTIVGPKEAAGIPSFLKNLS